MKNILIISDSHGFLPPAWKKYAGQADEIWHAGDIGSIQVYGELYETGKLRCVYGNIDGPELRRLTPEVLSFQCEDIRVLITHIGGYPGRYARGIPQLLKLHSPGIFVCGHSHILRVMRDSVNNLLHINPGACGRAGFHKTMTAVRITLDTGKIASADVIEFGPRTGTILS